MLIRYGKLKNGKRSRIAEIFTKEEHRINPELIDRDAWRLVDRLESFGYESYIVGGAVRDLLIGRKPKDFDIATAALPNRVRKIFRNSRIIGKRFRLVHVHFPDKIIEVSTFRSNKPGENANVYGTLEDDVKRRDFTMNALYYSPKNQYLYDFVQGLKDIREKRVRSLIPLETTFVEDSVRMIRAVKYAAVTGFKLPYYLRSSIKKQSSELAGCSSSRLTEELFKILQSGFSGKIIFMLMKTGLLRYILPSINSTLVKNSDKRITDNFLKQLEKLDKKVINSGDTGRGMMLGMLVEEFLGFPDEYESEFFLYKEQFAGIKKVIKPMTPPNQFVEDAVCYLFDKKGLTVPKKALIRHSSNQKKKSKSGSGMVKYRRLHRGRKD